jgi:hypothetical protein
LGSFIGSEESVLERIGGGEVDNKGWKGMVFQKSTEMFPVCRTYGSVVLFPVALIFQRDAPDRLLFHFFSSYSTTCRGNIATVRKTPGKVAVADTLK